MLYAVFLPLLFALFIPFLSKFKSRIHTGIFVLIVPLMIFAYFVRYIGEDFKGLFQSTSWISALSMNLDFHLDGLSLLFVLLISGIGLLVVLYSIFYISNQEKLGHFYVFLMIFMTAMLGLTLSDNVFVLYTFWELTSISSFLLIGFWHHKAASRYGAFKSMNITVFGGLSMLGGLVLLSNLTNTTSIREMIASSELILTSPYIALALGFILIGAFTKSAQFPFHIWLPDAMEAPTPVSAYLHSATMVKAGIYLVARFSPIFSEYEAFILIVTLVGVITLFWGSFMAVRQTDLKAILAYSTISQLGMIMTMLGIGTKAAIFAAVLHIVNHATFKGSLFMVAGIIDHQTGTRQMPKLGGLLIFMPITAALAMFGTFSMAGIPLPFLNGFYSKELFIDSILHLPTFDNGLITSLFAVVPYIVVIASIFTFVYSLYILKGIFFGKYKSEEHMEEPKEANFGLLIAPFILVVGVILLGLFPNMLNKNFLAHAAGAIANVPFDENIQFWHGFNQAFMLTLLIIFTGIILTATMPKWRKIYTVFPGKWSFTNIYNAFTNRVQPVAHAITNRYMTGSLRLYMLLIIITIVVGTGITMFVTGGLAFETDNLAPVSVLELVIITAMVVAAIATLFAKHNLSAILILGIVGFGTAMLFVLYRAPDLALTQLVIETITVVLFLLTFAHLPKLRKRTDTKRTNFVNLIVSISFGALLTIVAISSHSSRAFSKISDYFIETADTIGGGTNIVNVILVDMRGIDTLFEITVLGIAALAIHALIRVRSKKETD